MDAAPPAVVVVYERIRRAGSGFERVRPCAEAPRYWVGENGTLWRPRKGRLRRLKQQTNPDGYRRVTLHCGNRKRVSRYVHRLVLLAFVGPCPEGKEACHNDGNQRNNRLDNLRWDTPKANAADRIRARYEAESRRKHPHWYDASAPIPL